MLTLQRLAKGDNSNAIIIFQGSKHLKVYDSPYTTFKQSGRRKTSEPIIDYSKSILLTSDKYMTQLEGKTLQKTEVEEARVKKKKQIGAYKNNRDEERVMQEDAKKAYIAWKESKKAFDLAWSAKAYAKVGKWFHKAIKSNAPFAL